MLCLQTGSTLPPLKRRASTSVDPDTSIHDRRPAAKSVEIQGRESDPPRAASEASGDTPAIAVGRLQTLLGQGPSNLLAPVRKGALLGLTSRRGLSRRV